MKKTRKLKDLQLTLTTVRELTKVIGGIRRIGDETGVRSCSCANPCNVTDIGR